MTLTKKTNPFFPAIWNDLFENNVLTPQTAVQRGINEPAVNIKENENGFSLALASPGMKKEDFKINLNENILSVSAEVEEKKEENQDKYTRKEFSFSSFKRDFNLPESVDTESITANYFDGILTINIAKKEEAKPKPAREIAIN
ncbi:Hsp20/alpha crystallin family protein [Putridiphycobacter roseus]|uniref:Hsp20/alpha crystallin family protein n=1 Tax=Putridiphycobacter roseus TaxID=2219161 RepID=A0A2W1NF04_9FLAO|nr:Hsp20/alpha crystallin family protein [Putridiphycobacter roseus]PZE16646.1 Hsp20/alpha crystallin family protein [Putridiphycobacter roseus]